jgi:AcrR family transcriptional regulator
MATAVAHTLASEARAAAWIGGGRVEVGVALGCSGLASMAKVSSWAFRPVLDVDTIPNILSDNARTHDSDRRCVRFGTIGRQVSRRTKPMAEKKRDRRIERTRRSLLEALFSLIQEKGFDAVTVQDIIDRANVGRSTFYVHFVDKEDLLIQAMDPFSADLKERQRKALREGGASAQRAFAFSHELFTHADGHRDVFRAVVGKQSALILQRHFQRIQVDLVREEVRALWPAGATTPALLDAVVQSVAGALFGLLAWWIDGKRRVSVDEVSALFRGMALSAVRAAT